MTLPMLRLTVMALALLVAGAAYSNPPLPTPPESKKQEQGKAGEREQESSKDQRGTQNSPLIVEVLPTKNADEITKQKRDHENDKSFYDGLIAWATIALAFITFFLALYTAKLWNATKTLAEDAKRTADRQAGEMQDSLRIAQDSATAAKTMAATMKDTAERQLRAHAMVVKAEIVNVRPQPHVDFIETWIHVAIKNFGRTPATALKCTYAICAKEFPLRTALDGEPLLQVIGVIAPGDTFTAHLKIPLMNSHDLAGQLTALYVHGDFHYCDGFHPDRVTHFRYMRKGGDDWFRDGEIETCQVGNDVI